MLSFVTIATRLLCLACICLALSGLSGCQQAQSLQEAKSPMDHAQEAKAELPTAVAKAKQANAAVDSRLIAADNEFGFTLFSTLHRQATNSNLFISPVSVALALQMTYNGAHGATQQAMAKALHLHDLDLEKLNQANAALMAGLDNPDPKVQLRIANALYMRRSVALEPDFVQRNRDYYGAELGDLAGAPDNVNRWVSAQTNGKIPTLVGPDDVADAVALLVNAVYFKGTWRDPFEKALTRDEDFTLLSGEKKKCRMMHQSGSFLYYEGDHFQAVRLPYGEGRLRFVVILPANDTPLSALLPQLTLDNWKKWDGQFSNTDGNIGLPRFRIEYEAALVGPLTDLGMGVAFDPHRADFTGMGQGFFISRVKHKTYVDVNEEGTEAAAATSVAVTASAAFPRPKKHFRMIVDRPFVCAIVDERTDALLFLGAIVDPG